MDKIFDWDDEKNARLIRDRGVSFEAIIVSIEEDGLIGVVPGKGKYKHQKQLLVVVNQYVYIVPCVEDAEKVFLKTIIPSRKMTKNFLARGEL